MSEDKPWTTRDDQGGVLIRLRARPGASRNQITTGPDGTLKVRITAAAVDGAANRALIKFLSKVLSVPKSSIALRSGETTRDKVVFVQGVSADEVDRCLVESRKSKVKSQKSEVKAGGEKPRPCPTPNGG